MLRALARHKQKRRKLAGLVFAGPFVEGTEVLTPNGRVAIENLREGDLVIARDEETGQSGVFPITALMARQAPQVLWLTLENSVGETSELGVTAEHPMFAVDLGWTEAGDLAVGDQIRSSDLGALTILATRLDPTPRTVHNLEVAGAHTYFVGELEAWGHNSRFGNVFKRLEFWQVAEKGGS